MVMKTPGVYIQEKNAFPNSVVQVATAVPAFIGYTEKAMNGNVSLHETPMKITSISDFHSYFGAASEPKFKLQMFEERASAQPYGDDADMAVAAELPQAVFTTQGPAGVEKYELVQTTTAYTLYSAMRAFFLNGGGTCYVTSIGSYEDAIDAGAMLRAIKRLEKEPEPTMLVIPETTRLNRQDSLTVQQQMLMHCGQKTKNRFAILDVHGGYLDESSPRGDPIKCFRNDAGTTCLDYGAAYYPWLNSAVYTARDFTFENIELDSRNKFISLLKRHVKMDKAIVPEILKVGTAVISGDFTISVTKGGISLVKGSDIHAADDLADAAELKYKVVGAPKDATDTDAATVLAGQMKGKLVTAAANAKDADLLKADAIYTFTQKDVDDGKIRYVHAGTDSEAGLLQLVVTDNEDVQTSARKIVVMVGSDVLALPDVQARKPARIPVTEDKVKIEGIVLMGADEIDAVAVKNADDAVKTAREALAGLPDGATDKAKADAQSKVTAAEDAAVAAVKDKTVTRRGVGTWTVDGTEAILFTPDADFRGAQTAVRYKLLVGGALMEAKEIKILVDGIVDDKPPADPMTSTIDKTMRELVKPLYNDVMNAITKYMNVMPPSAAMAGVYTATDNTRGVWKAPANVSVAGVTGPMVNIDHAQQENLNVATTGKSINAIRPFVGEGTLVWGARTLDGNSLDWRYINVRRTMIMIEESIRLAAKAYVFEPNTAQTWVTVRSMIENFLTSVWKAGGLAGAVPTDAFSVHVGLGDTMTAQDILEGKLLITVLVAVSRPAEFIEITFQQQLQKS